MKTVMKKMFCLLLVAVMLVSAVPVVFAAEGEVATIPCPLCGAAATLVTKNAVPATCTTVQRDIYHCPNDACTYYANFYNDIAGSESGHSWKDATCNDPKTCNTCGATEGSKLGHDWADATCTAPQTCKRCGGSTGSASAHAEVIDAAVAATCTETGLTEGRHCSVCNTVLVKQNTVDALGHKLTDGKCTRKNCGFELCSICNGDDHTTGNCPNNMCPFCFLDNGACVKCSDGVCVMNEAHYPDCTDKKAVVDTKGKVRVYLNLNYGNAYAYGEQMEYIWVERNTPLVDVVASIPAPYRDKHNFLYWTTDMNGGNIIDDQNDALATADGVMIYAQWVDIIQSTTGTVDVIFNLGYGGLTENMNDIVPGTAMSEVLEYAGRPVRLNYKFVGWYWDAYYTNPVKYTDRVYLDCQVFAKWEYRGTNNEVMLKVYLNGDTTSLVQIIDMYPYTLDDGCVSLSEAKEAIKKFYTSKNSDGMLFEGLFDTDSWSQYTRNHKSYDGDPYVKVPYIKVNSEVEGDTVVYAMVHNAMIRTTNNSSTSSSSSNYKPDSSNPKTGDAIMTPVIVLTASVGALATLFYLNKKRSI